MYEVLLTVLGALIGFSGAMCGVYYAEYRRDKRELEQFYSWLVALLDRLLIEKDLEKVKEDLTTPNLHYTLNRLWTRIPQKDKELEVRELIFRFLKGGDELHKVIEDEKTFRDLREWLEPRSRK